MYSKSPISQVLARLEARAEYSLLVVTAAFALLLSFVFLSRPGVLF